MATVSTQYAVGKTATPSLTIGGADYTAQMVSWSVSDASAFKNGLLTTQGTLALSSLGNTNGLQIEDYTKEIFRRGTEVKLDLIVWDSSINAQRTIRHPRGLLYILGTSYSLTNEQLEINIGCKISLYMLEEEDNYELLSAYKQLPLQDTEETISNVGATLAAMGRAIYQDNTGVIRLIEYFSNSNPQNSYYDHYTGGAGEWISVNGVSAIEANPLKGAQPIPDQIELSYSYEVPDPGDGDPSRPNIVIQKYFLQYPIVTFEKIQTSGELDPSTGIGSIPSSTSNTVPQIDRGDQGNAIGGRTGCGNAPTPNNGFRPGQSVFPYIREINGISTYIGIPIVPGFTGCSDDYETAASSKILLGYSKEMSYSLYNAIGEQISYKYSERRGPALELNNQYYADMYAYCTNQRASRCYPGGGCGYPGTRQVIQNFQETFYFYRQDGSLEAEETHVYENMLASAKPSDYRSGVVEDEARTFKPLSATRLFRATVRRVEYETTATWNIRTEKIWTSRAKRGQGISNLKEGKSKGYNVPYTPNPYQTLINN